MFFFFNDLYQQLIDLVASRPGRWLSGYLAAIMHTVLESSSTTGQHYTTSTLHNTL